MNQETAIRTVDKMNQVEAILENNYGVALLEMGYLFKASEVFKSASKYLTLSPDNHPARNTCTHQQGNPLPFNGYEYRYDWVACPHSAAVQDDGEPKKQQPSKNSNEASISFLCLAAVKINVCSEHAFVLSDADCTCGIDWAICYSKFAFTTWEIIMPFLRCDCWVGFNNAGGGSAVFVSLA